MKDKLFEAGWHNNHSIIGKLKTTVRLPRCSFDNLASANMDQILMWASTDKTEPYLPTLVTGCIAGKLDIIGKFEIATFSGIIQGCCHISPLSPEHVYI